MLLKFSFLFLLMLTFFVFSAQGQKNKTAILSGTVTEKISGERLLSITVAVYPVADKNSDALQIRGVFTNKFGFYSIPDIRPGHYTLKASAVGYKTSTKEIEIKSGSDMKINIKMKKKNVKTQTVVVEESRDVSTTRTISKIDIDPEFINKMPALGGEVDVFRTLQLLPGVQQSSEMSSGLYIRGGSPDQNLVLLDGVVVYNPSHLFGFLSTFNSDALKSIRLIKGGFPAEYGGRLSSVIDLTMRDGSKEKITGTAGISIISSKATIEGPIGDDMTFMISGRRMYLDILTAMMTQEDTPGYYFYDFNGKFKWKISDKDNLTLSGFFGRDVLFGPDEFDFDVNWGNKTGSVRWQHIASSDLFTNFSFIYTNYNFESSIDIGVENEDGNAGGRFESLSQIEDLILKADADYYLSENHTIKAGVETTFHTFTSNAGNKYLKEIAPDIFKDNEILTFESAVYFQDEWKISDNLNANIGARLYHFAEGGYLDLEPRLSAAYNINEDLKITAAYALANQYLHLINRNDLTLPTDLWFPSTANVKPERSHQIVVGIEKLFKDGTYLCSIEGYYKTMDNLYEYKDSSMFAFGIPLEDQFTSGSGIAYGVELFVHKRIGDFTGWIGYTLAWTTRTFPELNNGKPFPPRYDRRHDFSIVAAYEFNKKWEVGMSWVYATGQAFTVPSSSYQFDPVGGGYGWGDRYYYTERNAFRLPAFHKLDLNLMYKSTFFGLEAVYALNIYNAYNHRNPFSWYIGYDDSEYDKKVIKQMTMFPIIPTFGIKVNF